MELQRSPLLHIMSQHTDWKIPLPGPQAHLEGEYQVGLRPAGLEKAVPFVGSIDGFVGSAMQSFWYLWPFYVGIRRNCTGHQKNSTAKLRSRAEYIALTVVKQTKLEYFLVAHNLSFPALYWAWVWGHYNYFFLEHGATIPNYNIGSCAPISPYTACKLSLLPL